MSYRIVLPAPTFAGQLVLLVPGCLPAAGDRRT